MTSITVKFDHPGGEGVYDIFPIQVKVGELLFEHHGIDLTNMSESDKDEFESFVLDTSAREAIDEALSVIATAPAYDDINVEEVDAPNVEATVVFDSLER